MKYHLLTSLLLVYGASAAAPLEAIQGDYVGTIQQVHGYPGEQGGQCSLSIAADEYFVTFEINGIRVKIDRKSVEAGISSGDKQIKITRYLGERSFQMAILILPHGRLRGVMVGETNAAGYNNRANWQRIVCRPISPR